jgi:hypothetical protein
VAASFCAARALHHASHGPPPPLRYTTRGWINARHCEERERRSNPDSRASHLDCFADARNDASPSLVTTGLDPVVHADVWRTERRGKSQKRAPRMDCRVIGEPTGPARSGRPMTGSATPFFERLCPAMTMLRSECRFTLPRQALDGGAAAGELVLEPLEAAVEVIDAVDDGLAFGGECRDHERHRCA